MPHLINLLSNPPSRRRAKIPAIRVCHYCQNFIIGAEIGGAKFCSHACYARNIVKSRRNNTPSLLAPPNTLRIPLSGGGCALVDSGQEALLNMDWRLSHGYAETGQHARGTWKRMQHLVLPAREGFFTDHINGDRLDNRRENLREVTLQQNNWNMCLNRNNKTGFKGVSMRRGKFRATINLNNKQIHVGDFATAELAAEAYDKKAKELFGDFAKLNFNEDGTRANLQPSYYKLS